MPYISIYLQNNDLHTDLDSSGICFALSSCYRLRYLLQSQNGISFPFTDGQMRQIDTNTNVIEILVS